MSPPPFKGWKDGVSPWPHIPLTTSLCLFTKLEGQPVAQMHRAGEAEGDSCSWNDEFCTEPAQIVGFLHFPSGGRFTFHCAGAVVHVSPQSMPRELP